MATSYLIAPQSFNNISEGQILTWRKNTYSNLNKSLTYTPSDMKDLKESNIMTFDEIKESIKERLIMFKSLGHLNYTDSVFVMIDSCVLCKYALPTIIAKLKKKYDLNNKNVILIASQINITENYYKFINKKKYPQIDFNRLDYNMKFIEGKYQFKMNNIIILKTDIIFDNKILIEAEKDFLQCNKIWSSKDRNEINDNAQLKLLVKLHNMFSKKCYFISRDISLLNKINNIAQAIPAIQSFHFI